ncbi:MAG: beta-glucosidase [Eubacteriales bacterium]
MKCTKEYRLSFTDKAKELISQMSLEEKVHLMSGWMKPGDIGGIMSGSDPAIHYNHIPYGAGGNDRLGIPPVLFCDGPRGVVCGTGKSTCFPVTMLRGATFDTELEEKVGRAIGREIRAYGGNFFGGVCINLPINPGWGRSQETYGEDSFAIGQMGASLTRGVQEENVIACVKHYAFNSMEISRFKCSVDCDRRTEREVYLPHFKDCVDAGAASIMSAYNLYKGTHCGHSDYLLRKVLKEEWDFDGFVISDFIYGVKDTVEGANGGMDIEMCWTYHFGDKLVEAVKEGLVPEERIDEAALRIVRTILAFEEAYSSSGKNYSEEIIGCKDHINLALEAARKGITLLKNDEVLPLDKTKTKKIAVIGKLADKANIGDHGSSRVYPAYVVTPLEGLRKIAPEVKIVYCDGSDIEAAKVEARNADAAIFVLGYQHSDEGEYVSPQGRESYTGGMGGDRKDSLGLHAEDINLIYEIAPENKNSVVVLIGGNMIMMTEWIDKVSSVLMAYYPGQEGGTAIAEILFGNVNPSGKIPFVIPYEESDLPQVNWDTTNQWYDYYHGYTRLEKEGKKPLHPYGFGMSYTTFEYLDPVFSVKDDKVVAKCTVKNTGKLAGDEVVQLYIGFKNSAVDRPVKLLRGFKRISLTPGESVQVEIGCPVEKLKWYDPKTAAFELEHMSYEVYIGSSSSDSDLLAGSITL